MDSLLVKQLLSLKKKCKRSYTPRVFHHNALEGRGKGSKTQKLIVLRQILTQRALSQKQKLENVKVGLFSKPSSRPLQKLMFVLCRRQHNKKYSAPKVTFDVKRCH